MFCDGAADVFHIDAKAQDDLIVVGGWESFGGIPPGKARTAAMILALIRELSDAGLPTGQWMGKTFDLSKAYKQMAVLPSHQKHAIVGYPVAG